MAPIIDKNTYASDPKFAKLRDAGVSYEKFTQNQDYYLRTYLSTTSLYSLGKALYEKYTALYNAQKGLFNNLKADVEAKQKKYDELVSIYAARNNSGEATGSDKNLAALNSGYTMDLKTDAKDAEIMMNVYLAGRQNAVSTQRRGLIG